MRYVLVMLGSLVGLVIVAWLLLYLLISVGCIYPANYAEQKIRFLYNGIIIKHQKTEPTYTKTSLFLCEKRRFFMARREKGVVPIIYFEKERGKSF